MAGTFGRGGPTDDRPSPLDLWLLADRRDELGLPAPARSTGCTGCWSSSSLVERRRR